MHRVRRLSPAVAVAALALAAAPAGAAGPTTFTGHAGSGHGRFAGVHARVTIVLTGFFMPVPSGARPAGTFTADVRGSGCAARPRCMTGRVTGTWTTSATLPDAGDAVALTGRGRLKGLGRVRVTATGQAPGNIASGPLTLRARVQGHGGRLRVRATGPTVPGFTAFF